MIFGQASHYISCGISEVFVCPVTRIAYVAQKRFTFPCHISCNCRSQARNGLTNFNLLSEKEYAKAVELAETCGLSLSNYIRKCALGQRPRRRLTEKEVEALCSLSDARGELIRIAAAVKSIQTSHRAQYFADTRFVEQWMRAAVPLIARWNEIQEYITQ